MPWRELRAPVLRQRGSGEDVTDTAQGGDDGLAVVLGIEVVGADW
ncbi:MAG: hypothetical protein R3E50_05840 [Halioglobus sp.]